MGEADLGDVDGRKAAGHHDGQLADELARVRAYNPASQYLVVLVSEDLDETVGIARNSGSGVRSEGEGGLLVLHATGLKRLLALADARNFRMSVYDHGNVVPVDVAQVLAQYVAQSDRAVLLRLVGQHGTCNDVSNGTDVLVVRHPELIVDDDTPALRFNAEVLEAKVPGEGPPAHGEQHDVTLEFDLLTVPLGGDHGNVLLGLASEHLRAQADLDALLFHDLLDGDGDVAILQALCRNTLLHTMVWQSWSAYSTMVTLAPTRLQTDASSRPIAPPPMTTICFGTWSSTRASSEVMMRFPSTFTASPGNVVTSDPVAMMMCLAVTLSPPSTWISFGDTSVPCPLMKSTPFFLKSPLMPMSKVLRIFAFEDMVSSWLKVAPGTFTPVIPSRAACMTVNQAVSFRKCRDDISQ
ncbi:60 kDa SS-A/Ro ribonucleoprotein isoform X1 [Babesia caballi]|uniref:60 kDa SS-A/Ro ribonucleoprotein isoform X1 n=1 Tax=Babesia caballi TaxID=5871 RepID=A0AAV4M0K1_BABCB|nr:60 kDa SS-A/Ro ribonucleoprotein isoform X1 [Babesia caballi]